jgi:hypothetical protein
MPERSSHERIASALLLSVHRFVEEAAVDAVRRIVTPPARPASTEEDQPTPANVPPHVRAAIASAISRLRMGVTLPYPPSEEARLSDEEISALHALKLEPAAP